MVGEILQFADLQELCCPGERPRLATVERWARKAGIRFIYDAKGGLISSVSAVNAALGLGDADRPYTADELF